MVVVVNGETMNIDLSGSGFSGRCSWLAANFKMTLLNLQKTKIFDNLPQQAGLPRFFRQYQQIFLKSYNRNVTMHTILD